MIQLALPLTLDRRFEIGPSRTTWRENGIVHVIEMGAHSVDFKLENFR